LFLLTETSQTKSNPKKLKQIPLLFIKSIKRENISTSRIQLSLKIKTIRYIRLTFENQDVEAETIEVFINNAIDPQAAMKHAFALFKKQPLANGASPRSFFDWSHFDPVKEYARLGITRESSPWYTPLFLPLFFLLFGLMLSYLCLQKVRVRLE
jgi:hypothetical protein